MRELATVLSIFALVSALAGQTPPDSLISWVEHHPLGIADALQSTDTHRVYGVEADSVWLCLDGWRYGMRPGRTAGDWFVEVPNFRESVADRPWDRGPSIHEQPALTAWFGGQSETLPLILQYGRAERD